MAASSHAPLMWERAGADVGGSPAADTAGGATLGRKRVQTAGACMRRRQQQYDGTLTRTNTQTPIAGVPGTAGTASADSNIRTSSTRRCTAAKTHRHRRACRHTQAHTHRHTDTDTDRRRRRRRQTRRHRVVQALSNSQQARTQVVWHHRRHLAATGPGGELVRCDGRPCSR
jgi:hypothetical protein